jgi:peptidoglycan hydrolase-like protein with peptidoglycan-binding domain
LLAGGGVLAVAIAAVAVVLTQSHSAAQNTTGTGIPAGDTTAEVSRRTLTESSTAGGTLGYGSTLELYDRLSGTFTWLPAVGAVIARGGTLWRVNNEPVALMYGSVPAYRTLKEGISKGPDVAELNQNLTGLGYDPYGAITAGEDFSEATAAALRRWQKAEGLSETGEVELGRIIFAQGARRVTAVKVALGQDPPGGAGAKEPAAGTKEEPANTKEPVAGTKGKPAGSKAPAGKKHPVKADKKEPAKESPSKEFPAKESSNKEPSGKEPGGKGENGGGGAGAGMVVLTTTSTQQLVQLKLKAEQQTLARVGQSAPVTLPGGDVVRGRIIDVGSVASAASEGEKEKGAGGGGEKGGEGESATIPVTLALEHPVAHLDQAPVSVELVKSIRRDVLAIPATALTATAGGGYAIEVLEGTRRVALSVTPGMFANGYVQVEGPGVREGLTVIESG